MGTLEVENRIRKSDCTLRVDWSHREPRCQSRVKSLSLSHSDCFEICICILEMKEDPGVDNFIDTVLNANAAPGRRPDKIE